MLGVLGGLGLGKIIADKEGALQPQDQDRGLSGHSDRCQ